MRNRILIEILEAELMIIGLTAVETRWVGFINELTKLAPSKHLDQNYFPKKHTHICSINVQ